jgi:hypothetical protein
MKRCIFLVCNPGNINNNRNTSIGVLKKIYGQIEAMSSIESTSWRMVCLPDARWRYLYVLYKNLYKNILNDENNLDFVYIRRGMPMNRAFLALLKRIKTNNHQCKILFEIPTYPYDKEHKTFLSRCGLLIDKIYRNQLQKYIDKIVTVSNDDVIFAIPTIKIKNGIRCADIPIRKQLQKHFGLHFIVVAQFAFYHGYERLIAGLSNYYKKNQDKIYIHFVGDGTEIVKYKALVQKYSIEEYCVFYGTLHDHALTDVFNKCDLGICSLGVHRIGLNLGSFLKSREYLARGLPIISSTKIDVIPSNFKYCLYVPEDESAINIEHVVAFYTNLLIEQTVPEMISEIRRFAEENCDISKTMMPVIEYISSDSI